MTITLRDIPSLVQYLLDHSYFTVGSQVFRQRRGASMGSQFAPVLCSTVTLQREWNFAMSFSAFTWDRSLHHRYVDNRRQSLWNYLETNLFNLCEVLVLLVLS